MSYFETQPTGCPPNTSVPTDNRQVLRLIEDETPKVSDFFSYFKLNGFVPKGVKPCVGTACSVFNAYDSQNKAQQITKLPKPRGRNLKYVATIQFDSLAGDMLEVDPKRGHVSWWIAKVFDPINAVIQVREIPE